ncbi:MAG: GNAT family N-acetyltransferase [Clostridiales bacterium]|nr:GNAT family N-acetyltransferase [Clostridiales bacterium]
MKFEFKILEYGDLIEIEAWRYEGVVEFIDVDIYFENYKKKNVLKGPKGSHGYAVYLGEKLVGIFEYYTVDKVMEIALALNPELVGKGLGKEFLLQGIEFGINQFKYEKEFIKLEVDEDNTSAIKTYLGAGFSEYKRKHKNIYMKKYLK